MGRSTALGVGELTGAGYGEKSAARKAQRDGHRERERPTRAGTVEGPRRGRPRREPVPRIPKLRKGSYVPGVLEPSIVGGRSIHPRSGGRRETAAGRMAEKALTAVVREARVQGISTRPRASS